MTPRYSNTAFFSRLKRYYSFYTGGFIAFIILMAILEQMGLSNQWIGYTFLAATIALYGGIGILSRTTNVTEYYVAGRRVPALFNGMATGADWMSAASFIGLAGTLYLSGYDGLAFVMGWTGGYVLVALFLAPYLRKFGQFTIPDFLGARYGGNLPRAIGVFAAILCSFVYVVAQIYGVGLIASRFTGLEFGVGVYAGLAGVLLCSFLGGMRAVTWTQVAQYIILITAYMIPVVWLSINITGNPLPQIAYGQALQQVSAKERELNDPHSPLGQAELAVRAIHQEQAATWQHRLQALDAAVAAGRGDAFWQQEKSAVEADLATLQDSASPDAQALAAARRAVADFPPDVHRLRIKWKAAEATARAHAGPVQAHATPFAGQGDSAAEKTRDAHTKRLNFIALMLCLMVGTASLPHILMRYYTTPSVREARQSVFWSLFFICLLYFTAPALAVLAKYVVYTDLVGSTFTSLPAWVSNWSAVDDSLMKITDLNNDGLIQLAEITIGGDLIVLAMPEIAGLPYVISGLVAAGGLAAALSTADGLLLTIANALSHDVYYKVLDPRASGRRRLAISKLLLLLVATLAAWVASMKPGDILLMVGAAFSLAAAAFFPALVMGVFWKRANHLGAVVGMFAGLGVCLFYMFTTYDFFGGSEANQWFGIKPIAAGVFGLPAGFVGIVLGSLLSPAPAREIQALVDRVRYPRLPGDRQGPPY